MPLRTAPLPRMAGRLSFMRAPVVTLADLRPGMVAALGVPLDSRRGSARQTRFGPTALRETSAYFGSHFSANMQAAMDIDRRRVLEGGLMSGGLVDLGDLCLEGLDGGAADDAIGTAASAIAARGALPLLLGGDLDIVPPALDGLARGQPAGTALVQLGGPSPSAPPGTPALWLGAGAPQALTDPGPAAGPAESAGAAPRRTRQHLGVDDALDERLAAATRGRRSFVVLDLSVLAAHWHGMHEHAPFDALGLRELRPVIASLGHLPLAGFAVTGLEATRSGLSTVKTGQRLILTALLDLLYRCLPAQRAAG